jgi:4-hydroxy-L-threonine phosphate dehydrogenase PdxA
MPKPIIGITMGDPAGIGPEICAKALTSPEIQMIANCLVIGDRKAMRQGLKVAKIPKVQPRRHRRSGPGQCRRRALEDRPGLQTGGPGFGRIH